MKKANLAFKIKVLPHTQLISETHIIAIDQQQREAIIKKVLGRVVIHLPPFLI